MSPNNDPGSINLRLSRVDIPDTRKLMSAEFAALSKKIRKSPICFQARHAQHSIR